MRGEESGFIENEPAARAAEDDHNRKWVTEFRGRWNEQPTDGVLDVCSRLAWDLEVARFGPGGGIVSYELLGGRDAAVHVDIERYAIRRRVFFREDRAAIAVRFFELHRPEQDHRRNSAVGAGQGVA